MPANKIIFKSAVTVCLLALFLTAYFITPEKTSILSCRFRQLTGYSCPTCGLTRSFHAFSHLDLREAFRFHLLGPVIYSALLLYCIKFLFELITGKEIKPGINSGGYKIIIVTILGALLCHWIIRFIFELLSGTL